MLNLLNAPTVSPAEIARMTSESEDERARQMAVIRARNFHAGRQYVRLTDRLRLFLADMSGGSDAEYLRLNICRTVVSAVVERLRIERIASPDDALAAFAQAVWDGSGGMVMADDAHEWATRDGEAFILVDWDAASGMPRLIAHPRYVDAALDDGLGTMFGDDDAAALSGDYWSPGGSGWSGQGFGCVAHYPDDDMSRPPLRVTKRWTEEYVDARGRPARRRRLTVYYPDRVEKFELRPTPQRITDDPGEPWPLPMIYNGQPLGILVVPLYNPGATCEAWEAIPLQNAINKQLVDLLTASDLTAFRLLFASGWLPTTDGKAPNGTNGLPVNPGQWVGSQSPDAKLQSIDGADLETLMAPIERMIQWAAMVTDTPVARFTTTRAIAAADTIKAQEGPLVAKVMKRQMLLGRGWAEAMRVAARLAAIYAPAALAGGDPDAGIAIDWEEATEPDETAELERLKIKRESLGVPRAQIWREAGYSQEEIAQMLADIAAERAASPIPTTTPTPGGTPAAEDMPHE